MSEISRLGGAMETTRHFIESFLVDEHRCHVSKWTPEITKSEHESLSAAVSRYFHPIVQAPGTYTRTGLEFSDEELVQIAPIKAKRYRKRALFRIKRYRNPSYGDVLGRIATGGDLYICYASLDTDTSKPSTSFFCTDTDEGLRIIYLMRFVEGQWNHQHDYEPERVNHPGILVEVNELLVPEDGVHLVDCW